MALLPLLMQNLMGYPVETAGWALAPRGISALISSYIAGRMVGKIDDRALILFGMGLSAVSYWQMRGMSPDMDTRLIIESGLVQGFASSFIFLPLTTLAFATIDPKFRPEATGFYNLARSIGGSVGISIVITILTRYTQASHEHLSTFAAPDNPLMRSSAFNPWYNLAETAGLQGLNAEVTRQASFAAYVDVFGLLAVLSVVMAPLVFFIRRPKRIVI
jgi:DHA2 family multidrug resistance protein